MLLRLAIRAFLKTPYVTLIAIGSLALGIGANTAMYSLFHQLLREPLPVADAGALVNLEANGPKPGNTSCGSAGSCDAVFSYPMFRDLERARSGLTSLAAHTSVGANLAARGQTASGDVILVSGSYFPTLGLRAAAGRLLDRGDDRAPGESAVAVLSHGYWTTALGADPGVVGQAVHINGLVLTIVGIAPASFQGTTIGERPLAYAPITLRDRLQPGPTISSFENRRSYWAYVFGRLSPGVTLEQARAGLAPTYAAILREVEAPLQVEMSEPTMKAFLAKPLVLMPGAQGQSSMAVNVRSSLSLLLGLTVLVLLIACANVANLLLVHSAARRGEMAIRLSIGAARRHLVMQLLIESGLLAVAGGLAGIVAAYWTLDVLTSILPADAQRTLAFDLDWAVLPMTASVTVATGLLFGLYPAVHSTRLDLATALKGQAGQPSGARSAARFRTALATAQIGLSLALLAAAGLFARSLGNIARIDLGLDPAQIVQFRVAPRFNGYTPLRSRELFARLEQALVALPGTASIAASTMPLLNDSQNNNSLLVEGFEAGPDTNTTARTMRISPGYFRTLGIPLLAGRDFTDADTTANPRVAIVNEAFVKKFDLGPDAVGRHIGLRGGATPTLDTTIVAVVKDAKYSRVKESMPPAFFTPYRQFDIGLLNYYVKTTSAADQVMPALRRIVSTLDPALPVDELRTLPQQIADNVFQDRFVGMLATAFAVLATALAAIGLYGVLAYSVLQRTSELGLRMALGASPRRVQRLVLGQVLRMLVVGGVIGLAAAFALGRAAESLLFSLRGSDPLVMTLAAVGLTTIALAAGFLPARRAARIDPIRALRQL